MPFENPPTHSPSLDDLLTDDDLRALAQPDHFRDRGELSPEHQRLLAMVLPEICDALLAQRNAADLYDQPGQISF